MPFLKLVQENNRICEVKKIGTKMLTGTLVIIIYIWKNTGSLSSRKENIEVVK